jgi:two-component system chemotaxis sensor kinase CheA
MKALPDFIKKVKGFAGCTILGNGNIGLILDITQVTGFEQ